MLVSERCCMRPTRGTGSLVPTSVLNPCPGGVEKMVGPTSTVRTQKQTTVFSVRRSRNAPSPQTPGSPLATLRRKVRVSEPRVSFRPRRRRPRLLRLPFTFLLTGRTHPPHQLLSTHYLHTRVRHVFLQSYSYPRVSTDRIYSSLQSGQHRLESLQNRVYCDIASTVNPVHPSSTQKFGDEGDLSSIIAAGYGSNAEVG